MKYIHHVRIHCNEYLVFRMKKNEINVIYFSVHDYCCTAYYFSLKLLLVLYKVESHSDSDSQVVLFS